MARTMTVPAMRARVVSRRIWHAVGMRHVLSVGLRTAMLLTILWSVIGWVSGQPPAVDAASGTAYVIPVGEEAGGTATPYAYPTLTPYPTSTQAAVPPVSQYPTSSYPTPTPYTHPPTGPSRPYAPPYPASGAPMSTGSSPLSGSAVGPGGTAPSGALVADPCYGDEMMTYMPEEPRIGNELLIAVTSSGPHPYGRLVGTERTQFVRERPGQKGIVWEWTIQPSYPGDHQYTFYVDSTIPCQKIQLKVSEALATVTLTPTKTPTPYAFNNDNNGNSNGNGNGNDNTSNTGHAPAINPYQYLPGYDAYDCGAFLSQAQAQSVLRANPSDPNHLDDDNDGVACESYGSYPYRDDRDESTVPRTFATPTATPTATIQVTPTATTGPFDVRNYLGQGDRFNCTDFASQANAQAVLRADPSDPNKLDVSNPQSPTRPDGIACNTQWDAPDWSRAFYFPSPYDLTPVATRVVAR